MHDEFMTIKRAATVRDWKTVFAVKNPLHGTLKYGAMGFLIPLPGSQFVGMATGFVLGIVPSAKKWAKKIKLIKRVKND